MLQIRVCEVVTLKARTLQKVLILLSVAAFEVETTRPLLGYDD